MVETAVVVCVVVRIDSVVVGVIVGVVTGGNEDVVSSKVQSSSLGPVHRNPHKAWQSWHTFNPSRYWYSPQKLPASVGTYDAMQHTTKESLNFILIFFFVDIYF